MTILKLAIDATQAKQGAREVEQAVDQVGRSAERAGKAVDTAAQTVGRSLDSQAEKAKNFSKTVEAVGEVTQISQRVRLLGEEVRNLGSGMGSAASIGQTLSGALIDIAQISGKVEGGFAGFIGLLRANPLLVAATVIGGIATAMSLFGGETKETNAELERQIQLQKELAQAGQDLALQIQKNQDLQRIGFEINQKEQELLRSRQIAGAASALAGASGFQRFADLTRLTGLSEEELKRRAGYAGIEREVFPRTVVSTPGYPGASTVIPERVTDIGIKNEAARQILLEVAKAIREEGAKLADTAPVISGRAMARPGDYNVPLPPGYQPPMTGEELARYQRRFGLPSVEAQPSLNYNVPLPPGYRPPMTEEELARYQSRFAPPTVLPKPTAATTQEGEGFNFKLTEVAIQQAEKRVAEFNERMRELKTLGQDVGTAIGSAFFSIVNGAANARQALAALLQQFVAIAQQRAIQGIANSIGNAFGSTVGQANANAQTPGTANTGTSLRGATP